MLNGLVEMVVASEDLVNFAPRLYPDESMMSIFCICSFLLVAFDYQLCSQNLAVDAVAVKMIFRSIWL